MIGVFDSGFGGLNILKYFINSLPNYDFVYLGDNARAPYGPQSQEALYNYTCQAIDFLFSKNCSLIIIACNSASSKALRKIQQGYLPIKHPEKKVLGVIVPIVEKIAEDGNMKRVGVISTEATINSGVFQRELKKIKPKLKVYQQAASQLASLIERDIYKERKSIAILKRYLEPLKKQRVDGLILGCTHYPILINEIQEIMGDRCFIPHPGEIITQSLKRYLFNHPELNLVKSNNPKIQFYTTGEVDNFEKMGEKFLERKINNTEKINL